LSSLFSLSTISDGEGEMTKTPKQNLKIKTFVEPPPMPFRPERIIISTGDSINTADLDGTDRFYQK